MCGKTFFDLGLFLVPFKRILLGRKVCVLERKEKRLGEAKGWGWGVQGPLKCEECATFSHCLSWLSHSKKAIMPVESGKLSVLSQLSFSA